MNLAELYAASRCKRTTLQSHDDAVLVLLTCHATGTQLLAKIPSLGIEFKLNKCTRNVYEISDHDMGSFITVMWIQFIAVRCRWQVTEFA